MIALTTEEFIQKARAIHGDRYDYSKVSYRRMDDKVTIICSIDGEFEQRPRHHLFGNNCPKCTARNTTMRPRSNIKEFIQKAIIVHGDRYDYSKVDYTYSHAKVTIICPKHGEFEQSPSTHLSGYGCVKCGLNKSMLTQQEFIEKAKQIHGDRYDYSKAIYIYSQSKVIIVCREHGEFLQKPSDHLIGSGCPLCAYKNKTLTTEEFIQKARAIHGDRYDYSKVVYTAAIMKIVITCPDHGDFTQTPNSHLSNKSGCPTCKASKGELVIKAILDKHNIIFEPQYRIPEIVANYEIDFYLPSYNILIEFHGIQHYEYIPFFHRNGEDDLLVQKNRDDIVRDIARNQGYRYLEFNYKQLKYMSQEEFEILVIKSINRHKNK